MPHRRRQHSRCYPIATTRIRVLVATQGIPSGFAGVHSIKCIAIARLSGPVIDRFDLHVQLPPVAVTALREAESGETSEHVRKRVEHARAVARARKAEATPRKEEAALREPARQLLHRSIDVLGLSLRAYTKVLRVGRTLADLEGLDAISTSHIAEAVQYRQLDRDPRSQDSGGAATIKR